MRIKLLFRVFILKDINHNIEINLCKHCSNHFIAENIKSEYGSIQCRNRENLNKSRQKKNNYIE